MAVTTITSVQLPKHAYPHVEVNINDNTIRTYVNQSSEYCKTLCVFTSPKGPDGLRKVTGGISEFDDLYGNGSVAEYGQALLNARALAETNACTLYCLRLTAEDAKVSNMHIFLRCKLTPFVPADAEHEKAAVPGKLQVYFVARPDKKLKDPKNLCAPDPDATTDADKNKYADNLVRKLDDDENGWYEIRFMSIASLGKGQSGNRISVRLATNTRADKTNNYKNYVLSVWEGGVLVEQFNVCFDPEAIVRNRSRFIENVVNDDDYTGGGSQLIKVDYNDRALSIMYDLYKLARPDTNISYENFDPFLGLDKNKLIEKTYGMVDANKNYNIDGFEFVSTETMVDVPGDDNTVTRTPLLTYDKDASAIITLDADKDGNIVTLDTITGINLDGGDDGNFKNSVFNTDSYSYSESSRDAKITERLVSIFNGKYKVATAVAKDSDGNPRKDSEGKYIMVPIDASGAELITSEDSKGNTIYKKQIKKYNAVSHKYEEETIQVSPYMIFDHYPYEDIMSKNRCPIDFVLDANFDYTVKIAMAKWATELRKDDFMVYFDNGTSETMTTKEDAYITRQADYNDNINYWNLSMDAYYGKIRDPYNNRIVEVTSTYELARKLPLHWKIHNGKHIPFAGSKYGTITSYLPNSVFPLMDECLDSAHMDYLVEEHINYAQINSKGDVIRGTQTTRYPKLGDANTMSNLSEINNCHIVLDIKHDTERLLENLLFEFNEPSDVARFNNMLSDLTSKYAAAQVRSISATFDRTDEEAEYGILHLYISLVHKTLVKIAIVDIDVNRNN